MFEKHDKHRNKYSIKFNFIQIVIDCIININNNQIDLNNNNINRIKYNK